MLSEKCIKEMLAREIATMKMFSKSYGRSSIVAASCCEDKIKMLVKIIEISGNELREMYK